MISQESIDKFNSIIAHYKLDIARILDVGRAICTSDILYGTNDKKLSIKRLANSGVDIFRPLYSGNAEPLPDVQVMRVICDTLYYNLLFKGKGVGKVGIHITSEASDSIGKGIGNKQYIPVANGYSDMEECQKVLDLMYEGCKNTKDWDSLVIFDNYIAKIVDSCRNKEVIVDTLKSYTHELYVPVRTKYVGIFRSGVSADALDTINRIKLKSTLAFMFAGIKSLSNSIGKNSVKANFRLARLLEQTNQQVGTFSITPDIPSFEYRYFNGSAVYFIDKLDKIFTKSKPLDFDDIPFLAAFYDYFNSDDLKMSFKDCLTKFEEVE